MENKPLYKVGDYLLNLEWWNGSGLSPRVGKIIAVYVHNSGRVRYDVDSDDNFYWLPADNITLLTEKEALALRLKYE
jgi:hypothetical protein